MGHYEPYDRYLGLLVGVNVPHTWLVEATLFLNCKAGSVPFQYLGLPVGANPRKRSTWKPVVDVVRTWLSCWKNKNLSQIVLIKSVSFALIVYYLFLFKTPSSCMGNCGVQESV